MVDGCLGVDVFIAVSLRTSLLEVRFISLRYITLL